MNDLDPQHPRYISLKIRNSITAGYEVGITSVHGLVAHGRGEAFDYLIGEKTQPFAKRSIETAAALLRSCKHPVVSVNGNAAALVPTELVELAESLRAPLEVNIFHASKERERAIQRHLVQHGAGQVLLPSDEVELPNVESGRRFVHPEGIFKADAVFVPLEDGDRCQALRKMNKAVVTVDLNPLSRTSRSASVTIIDNVVRALPLLVKEVEILVGASAVKLQAIVDRFDNDKNLDEAVQHIRKS